MKVPDVVKTIWVERMDPDVDYFSRIEGDVLVIRIYHKRKKDATNETGNSR